MNPHVRVIRFARVTAPAGLAGGEIIACVLLDEAPAAAGLILRSAAGWRYALGDGSAAGLASSHSRQDLERQIVLYHLGPMPAANAVAGSAPETKTWFARAV